MKRHKLIVLFLFCALLSFSCNTIQAKSYSSFYFLQEDKVYYVDGGLFEHGEPDTAILSQFEVKEADAASFLILSNTYGKDKNHVYRYGKILPKRDAATFQLFGEQHYYYNKDKNNVYYKDQPVPQADPGSFQVLEHDVGYAKDKQYVFYGHAVIAGADPFTAIIPVEQSSSSSQGGYYLKDANAVYYLGEPIQGAHPGSFEFILDPRTVTAYARDHKHVFYENHLLAEADPDTFQPVFQSGDGGVAHAEGWFFDKSNIYWAGRKVTAIDPNSLRFLETDPFEPGVFLDKNHVFFHTVKIQGADPATFVLLGKGYAKDANNVYYEENVLPGGHPDSFQIAGGSHYLWYGKDNNSVYMNEKKILGAEAKTFQLIDNHSFSRDRKHIFYVGELIEGADPDTFRKADFQHDGWAAEKVYHVDKNHVFFDYKIIPQSDVKSFTILEPFFAKDKNHVYYEGKAIPLLKPKNFRIINGYYGDFEDDQHQYRRWRLVED